jgi:hypothetical protein
VPPPCSGDPIGTRTARDHDPAPNSAAGRPAYPPSSKSPRTRPSPERCLSGRIRHELLAPYLPEVEILLAGRAPGVTNAHNDA